MPCGRRIAVRSHLANRHEKFEEEPLNTEIYEYDIRDGTVKALTTRMGPDDLPEVSPDGKLIAYTWVSTTVISAIKIYVCHVMNRDGSGRGC